MRIHLNTSLILTGLELPAGEHELPERFREQATLFAGQNPNLAKIMDEPPTEDHPLLAPVLNAIEQAQALDEADLNIPADLSAPPKE